MFTTIALLALFSAQGPTEAPRQVGYRPRIELWTNHGDAVYTRGQDVRVYFRTDRDAFVTILRVDTDGRVRVLFPRDPWDDNFARGDRDYEIDGYSGRDAFRVDDYPGVGYIFGVAAADPFTYDAFVSADRWDYRAIADGRVRGDPYVALTDLATRIVPADYADWDYDLVPYHVERHYDYPRFLCYECHGYASWVYWNPYHYSCVRFRIVIYDDPWYYPYRYYGGTRVVFVRPYRPEPRFIFKDRRPTDVFVTRARQRPVNERGVTRRDLSGIVAPPRDRLRPEQPARDGGQNTPDRRDRPDRLVGPDQPTRPDRSEQPSRSERSNQPDRPWQAPRTSARETAPGRTESRSTRPEARPSRGESRPSVRSEPRAAPERGRATPRAETRRPEPRRAEPQRSEPRRAEPQRSEPRRSEPSKAPQRREPELKRRKP